MNLFKIIGNNTLFFLKLSAIISLFLGELMMAQPFPASFEEPEFMLTIFMFFGVLFWVIYRICKRYNGHVLVILVVSFVLILLSRMPSDLVNVFFIIWNLYVLSYCVVCLTYKVKGADDISDLHASECFDLKKYLQSGLWICLFFNVLFVFITIYTCCISKESEVNKVHFNWDYENILMINLVFIISIVILLICKTHSVGKLHRIENIVVGVYVLFLLVLIFIVFRVFGDELQVSNGYVIMYWFFVLLLIPAYFFSAFFVERERVYTGKTEKKKKNRKRENVSVINFLSTLGLLLSALGFYISFYSETFVQADDIGTALKRVFDEERNMDYSFSKENVTDTISHIVFVLDVTGSTKEKVEEVDSMVISPLLDFIVCQCEKNNMSSKYIEKIKNDIVKEVKKKKTIFLIKALYQLMLLKNSEYSGDVSLIAFGEKACCVQKEEIMKPQYNQNGDLLLSMFNYIYISYLCPDDTVKKEVENSIGSTQYTDFVDLFKTIINFYECQTKHIHPDKNPSKIPEITFLFFTDYMHDMKEESHWKRKIGYKLDELNRKANHVCLLHFDKDIEDYDNSKYTSKKFPILPLIKDHLDKESYILHPIIDATEDYPLAVVWLDRRFPFYYKSPFSHPMLESRLILDSLVCKKIRFSIVSGDEYPKHHFRYKLVDKNNSVLAENSDYIFVNHIPVEIQKDKLSKWEKREEWGDSCKFKLSFTYNGPIPQQFPNYTLVIEDVDKRICYKMNIVFFREFHPYAKYALYFFCVIILSLIFYKFMRIRP